MAPLEEGNGLEMTGTLDLSTADQARTALQPLLRPGAEITLDLGGVEFMDSTGLNLIIEALGVVGDQGRLTVRTSAGIVGKVLSVSGLTDRPNLHIIRA